MITVQASSRGQVLIIFVFAIIGLIGITGLAIDGGNIYSDRRHAQNAADTASLAGALEKIKDQKQGMTGCTDLVTPTTCGADVANAALNVASDNGYTSNVTDNTVEVHIPPVDGPYKDCSQPWKFNCLDYIQVIINTNVNTWFARVLGIAQLHNRVEAVALARYAVAGSLYGGNSLVELKPYNDGNCSGDFIIGGNGSTITLNGGGVFVNSSNTCAAYKEGSNCPTVILNGGATIQVIGTVNTNGCTQPPSPIKQATTQYPYPPDPPPLSPALIPPAACNQTPLPSEPDTTMNGFTDFYPGHYASLPPTKNSVLEPGVYCLDSLVKLNNSDTLYGNGVFIYFMPSTQQNPLDITGGLIQLSAPTTGPYAHFLMYIDTTNFSSHPSCTINGGSNDSFQGIIYAPACAFTINGSSSPTGYSSSQVIAYTLQLNGSQTLNFTYDPNTMPKAPEIQWTGLFH
ncbi:MAG TPA: pilus assembly protein TadG-related protein [Anaerolineales bacterium]